MRGKVRRALARIAGRVITFFARAVTAVQPVWAGIDPDQDRQRVYYANHASHGDFILIWAVLPPRLQRRTRPVAGADYWQKGPLRRFVGGEVFDALLIARQAGAGSGAAVGRGAAHGGATDAPPSAILSAIPSDVSAAMPPDPTSTMPPTMPPTMPSNAPSMTPPELPAELPGAMRTDGPSETAIAAAPDRLPVAATVASPDASSAIAPDGRSAMPPDGPPAMPAEGPVGQMAAALGAGASLIIFPEGTRNQTDARLLPFKSGLYHLARRCPQIDLVPVWIENLNRVLPKGAVVPVPLMCKVSFGAPLHLAEAEDKAAFLGRARDALLALAPQPEGRA